MPANLYEVVRWGNDASEEGADGADTCFLVRAATVEEAATLADKRLSQLPHEKVQPWSHAVYLLGTDAGTDGAHRVLRGPYFEHALAHGWRVWLREAHSDAWAEWERPPG